MQDIAGSHSGVQVQTPSYKPDPVPEVEASPARDERDLSIFTMSVEEVRGRMADLGIQKSKDTIQRYCRNGDLDCEKLGILQRYFADPRSVEKLIQTMHPEATASNSTTTGSEAESGSVQVHEGEAIEGAEDLPHMHETAPTEMQVHADHDAPARTDEAQRMHRHEGAEYTHASVLQAKLDSAEAHITSLKEEVEFLREEVKESRGNRRDVTMIAERMLGTLETMASGGRLQPGRKTADTEPVQATYRSTQEGESGRSDDV